MKNALNYYYNLVPNDIHQNKNEYFFEYKGNNYIAQVCTLDIKEIEEIHKLTSYMANYNVFFHQIMFNIDNQLITEISGKPYIVMKKIQDYDKKVSIEDIIEFSNYNVFDNYKLINKSNWRNLWIQRIDYIEYQVSETKNKFKVLSEYIDYFIGMTEIGIQMLLEIQNIISPLVVAHKRMGSKIKYSELYNPLNIIVDVRVRDSAEYFKMEIFNGGYIVEDIIYYFNNSNLSSDEIKLFFIRLLFPTPFYDLYDRIMREEIKEDILIKIVENINHYEKEIKKIYKYLYDFNIVPEIGWLKKT